MAVAKISGDFAYKWQEILTHTLQAATATQPLQLEQLGDHAFHLPDICCDSIPFLAWRHELERHFHPRQWRPQLVADIEQQLIA
jgi:hypothetical protein